MQPSIHWYPGHIAKYERQLTELLKLVDVVVEVLDCRMPLATINPRLESKIRHKPTLIILNKSDLGDPAQNRRWKDRLTQGKHQAILYNAKQAQGKAQVVQSILAMGETAWKRLEARGRKRRPLRVLVAGMPNVGKSTLINSIVGQKKVKTGHRAGVTTDTRWVRIHPEIELMDSPGIIPPQLDDQTAAYLLATVSSIGEAAFDDEETARFLIDRCETLYPGLLAEAYKIPDEEAVSLHSIAAARHFKLPGEKLDSLRAAQSLLTDFRNARIGRVSLQHVQSHPNPTQENQLDEQVHINENVDEPSTEQNIGQEPKTE